MSTTNILDLNNRIDELEKNNGGGSADSAKRSDIATEFNTTTAYTAGCFVYHEGKLYQFNADHAAGAWDPTDVVEANVTDQIVSNKSAIDALADNVVANPTGETTATLTALEVAGTKYAISGGGGGGTDQYSTTETQTNKIWIDNKPIYRKVIMLPTPKRCSGSWTSTDIDVSDISFDKIITLIALGTDSGSNYTTIVPLPFMVEKNNTTGKLDIINYQYDIYVHGVILEYTKTA